MAKHEHSCAKRVFHPGGIVYGSPCRRAGKYFEEGKWWCKPHLPSEVQKRREAREKRWDAEHKANDRCWSIDGRIQTTMRQIVALCRKLPVPPEITEKIELLDRLTAEFKAADAAATQARNEVRRGGRK